MPPSPRKYWLKGCVYVVHTAILLFECFFAGRMHLYPRLLCPHMERE
jgi:hypothetical protein